MMKQVDVCLSPDLIHLYDLNNKTVVVVDVLRATSCMTAGIANQVKSIFPLADLEECRSMKNKGYIIAGERNGQKVDGFDLGNSPYDYMDPNVKGKKIAVTTTNGTLAIDKSKKATDIIIGSFLNKTAVANYLIHQNNDVIILCSGWKGKFNLEDSLFAGALVEALHANYQPTCDAPLAMQTLYKHAKNDLVGYLSNSSHVKRLNKLNIAKDIAYCLKEDVFDVVPRLVGNEIVADNH